MLANCKNKERTNLVKFKMFVIVTMLAVVIAVNCVSTTRVVSAHERISETAIRGIYLIEIMIERISFIVEEKIALAASDEEQIVEEQAEEISVVKQSDAEEFHWDGPVLNAKLGTVEGPSGKETYYNLDMTGVIRIMRNQGYQYEYWVRDDGVKMFGDYVMCAANLELRPRGTIIETSLGTAIVCDTGGFASNNPYQLDIAVNW